MALLLVAAAAAAAARGGGGGGGGGSGAAGRGRSSLPHWATAAGHMLPAERERLRLQAKEMFYHGYDSVRVSSQSCLSHVTLCLRYPSSHPGSLSRAHGA